MSCANTKNEIHLEQGEKGNEFKNPETWGIVAGVENFGHQIQMAVIHGC